MRVIILGGGEVGQFIARNLSNEGQDVVIIEHDEMRAREIEDSLDVKVIVGSGGSPQLLKEAGIESAEMLVAVTNSDEVNMIACFIAGSLSSIVTKVARVRNKDYTAVSELLDRQHLNIDKFINPEMETAQAILKILKTPHVTHVSEFVGGSIKLVSIQALEESKAVGQRLSQLMSQDGIGQRIMVAAIWRVDHLVIPKGDDVIQDGDRVYIAYQTEDQGEVMQFFGYADVELKRVMIDGGTPIGQIVAGELEKEGVSVRIFEKDQKVCSDLIRKLDHVVVLNDSATDQSTLLEENIHSIHAFLAVTNDEEDNILSSLLAKRLGAQRVLALANSISYLPLISAIGIDIAISPRMLAANAILQYIRRGKVLSVTALEDGSAEVIESVALECSNLVNTPIRKLKLPEGILILAIQHGEDVYVPNGESIIYPDDHLVILCLRTKLSKLEDYLSVGLEYF